MSTTENLARIERTEFAQTLLAVGPDAPTLCTGWTTLDLAAHIVLRERRLDAAPGIAIPFLSNYTESVRLQIRQTPWPTLVEQINVGPPNWSPLGWSGIDDYANLFEFFVHHEDVLRANKSGQTRVLSTALTDKLLSRLHDSAWLLWRRARVGVVLTDGTSSIVAKRPPKGAGIVTITGSPAELVMKSYGRSNVAVEISGAPHDLELLAQTNLSI